jgi:hypothetical protein
MKTIMRTLTSYLLSILLTVFYFTTANATNYNNYGTFATYSLNSGDTLRIRQGIFNGVIANLASGGVIIVAQNAVFAPSSFTIYAPAGKIINNGTVQFSSLAIYSGFALENNNKTIINGSLSCYSGTAKTFVNSAGARIIINGSMAAYDHTTITNNGLITIAGAVSLYNASQIINKGLIITGGSFSNDGQLTNDNVIRIAGDFSNQSGQVINTGEIEPAGNLVIGPGITYVNSCRLIAKTGIVNYGTIQNNGLVWAGTSNTSSDQLTNYGTFINASYGKVRMASFTDYGPITGGGFFYATRQTTLNGGTIGITGFTYDSIRIYDLTRSNPSQIFDVQLGSVRPNVKYAVFAAPDSIEMYPGCSDAFRNGLSTPLPVNWNYFYVNMVHDQPVLYWSAEYEPDMKFELERSYNNVDFCVIKTMYSHTTASYSFTDAMAAVANPVISYRIRATSAVDGSVKYSEIRFVKTKQSSAAAFSVYPNPSTGAVRLTYMAQANEQLIVRIKNGSGQQLFLKTITATAGVNHIDLGEVNQLVAGVYFIDLIRGNEIIASEKMLRR